jgi:D-lactate dehydrogenase
MLNGNYTALYERLTGKIDKKSIFHDPLHTLAYGTDASFYRLIPKMVIRTKDESEVSMILKECTELAIPVTFRAAGTSLSGQAITDSVLIIAGNNWNKFNINEDGTEIRVQPGLTGGRVNSLLAPFKRKIGPDPASVDTAMIGGIAANNASGMCCGTAENSYKTVSGIRLIFADGTLLDTSDDSSKSSFQKSHSRLLSEISDLAISAKNNTPLAERIRKKYKMKNTTGYSLNALIDYSDPFDIIEHLMIGSEGTLGFISEIRFRTVANFPNRASSLMIFPDIYRACQAVSLLKETPVSAVELIDRSGLHSVENKEGIPQFLKQLGSGVCALLVETVALNESELNKNIERIVQSILTIPTETAVQFTSVQSEYELLWNIRKGLFPSVGAMRKTGTTVIIEDIAFPLPSLADGTTDLRKLLIKYNYDEAVIFGHALEGNLHFVFAQDFNTQSEIDRYSKLMMEVSEMVVHKYDGSLKAEHGTGRNMAPFVELEWGKEAYNLMKEIKRIFDPSEILNPGVILNPDKEIHVKNLKPLPAASEIIDKCTECGFCEPSCVSADLTLTPRQRIVIFRELKSLTKSGQQPHIAASLAKSFRYDGDETCATDGLCATTCPVKIDTGKLVKNIRKENIRLLENRALWIADRMKMVTSLARMGLSFVNFFHIVLGTRIMRSLSGGIRAVSGNRIPLWNQYFPTGSRPINTNTGHQEGSTRSVVYFPSCINRSMGVSHDYVDEKQLSEKMVQLLHKGGFEVIYPENMNNLCCGMAFLSKGYTKAGEKKSGELEAALMKATRNGEYPVLCDMSPCLYTMKENMSPSLKLYEPVEFIADLLLPYLEITPVNETISVFPVCSMKKMGLEKKLIGLARSCAKEVLVPETNCCGFAGDRGFTYPELNSHGLQNLKKQLPQEEIHGYSNSRTCEIGLSLHSGISYKSIIYLADKVSSPKTKTETERV